MATISKEKFGYEKVSNGARLIEGGGVKRYMGNAHIHGLHFKKGLPLSGAVEMP